jgi:hypothetical protein
VRAGIIDGMIAFLEIEEGYRFPLDLHPLGLARS